MATQVLSTHLKSELWGSSYALTPLKFSSSSNFHQIHGLLLLVFFFVSVYDSLHQLVFLWNLKSLAEWQSNMFKINHTIHFLCHFWLWHKALNLECDGDATALCRCAIESSNQVILHSSNRVHSPSTNGWTECTQLVAWESTPAKITKDHPKIYFDWGSLKMSLAQEITGIVFWLDFSMAT